MFRIFILILLINSSVGFAAKAPLESIIDVLRDTPATVRGEISLDQTTEVYRKEDTIFNIHLRANAHERIGYEFNENHLELKPAKGLTLSIQGIPVSIKEIRYDNRTKKFSAKTESPLGIGQDTLNAKIEESLNEKYKPKMIQAYNELSKIKNQRGLKEVGQIVETVGNIFATDNGKPLPGLQGEVKLIFDIPKKKVFTFGDWKAHVDDKDNFSAGISFVRKNNTLAINSVEFNSKQGIRLHGQTKVPELNSIVVNQLKLDANGVTLVHRTGLKETIAGFGLVSGLMQTLSGQPVEGAVANCDCEIPLTTLEAMVTDSISKQLKKLVKNNRKVFVDAKFSPEFLRAFD